MSALRKTLAALALGACLAGPAVAADAPEPSEAALAFAGAFSDEHLAGMLSRIGARQPALVALSQLQGNVVAAVFDAEIDEAVSRYGPEWQRNMAQAWMPLLTEQQFASLSTDGAQSPYVDTYLENRDAAGTSMQELSADLFRTILQEVVNNTIRELADTPAPAGSD